MKKTFVFLLCLASFCLFLRFPVEAGVPSDVQQALMRGINLEAWMEVRHPGFFYAG